jgi:hypothetical protein
VDLSAILCTLAPAHTTLVLAASRFPTVTDAGQGAGGQEVAGRSIRYLDLHSYDREAVGR